MLELYIQTLLDDGWLFNNCYQTDDSLWRANIRRPAMDGTWFTEWATGFTFLAALEGCLSKVEEAELKMNTKVSYFLEKPMPTRTPPSLEDIA